ncbi:site-specific integrase [Streptomyces sp. NBC_00869]|uniref:site-specific integrase n=1 Tax=unclassified Streptomyces TaxID=2593676 RepID=UPI002ED078F7|nr:site-specific integrase [Streptomyces sp. NBC_00891]WSZ07026.1 site-specific integrase [Streptomyces sp. NBC_00869]
MLEGWEDLAEREESVGVRPGDPILLAPDYRVDEVLGLYFGSRSFAGYTRETKRNYATDLCLFFNFLWLRGKLWTQAIEGDLEDYQYWRQESPANPVPVGDAKWNRELAALTGLYKWASKCGNRFVARNPVQTHQVMGRRGEMVSVPALRAKGAKKSNVHWLTPRAFRRWVDVGLRGYTRDGLPGPRWVGRLEDRNVSYAHLLSSSGMRRLEGGSLLTFEVPSLRLEGGRYYAGRVAAAVTRSKKSRTFYASAGAVGEVESYIESSRAAVIRNAQAAGRYDGLSDMRMVTKVTGGPRRVVHWCDRNGVIGATELNRATDLDRMAFYTEGPRGPEPLWLWLNERGLPFLPHSWDGVFATANNRCREVLAPEGRRPAGVVPGVVEAPYLTVHGCRHSFALYMLVILHHLMDERFGLSPEERRDYRLLYGDPWRMVQDLLGHASRETTVEHYLAPVADLQLRSLLATASVSEAGEAPGSLDSVFARLAREAEGIQDIDDRMQVVS